MNKKFITAISAVLISLTLSSCGYQGGFRYSCQDPANWESAECKPPVCEVNGACPEDLVGSEIVNGDTSTIDPQTQSESVEVND
jgi:hypothetical protein